MGELYALACALVWSFAVILFQRSMEQVGALALNLFRSSVSVPLLLLTLAATGTPLLRDAPARDYLILLASGVIGIAVADTLFHYSLNLVGRGDLGDRLDALLAAGGPADLLLPGRAVERRRSGGHGADRQRGLPLRPPLAAPEPDPPPARLGHRAGRDRHAAAGRSRS